MAFGTRGGAACQQQPAHRAQGCSLLGTRLSPAKLQRTRTFLPWQLEWLPGTVTCRPVQGHRSCPRATPRQAATIEDCSPASVPPCSQCLRQPSFSAPR